MVTRHLMSVISTNRTKLLLGRGEITDAPNPHGEEKPNQKPDSRAKAFLAHGFKEIRATCWLFSSRYKNRRKYLNEHQTKQSKTKQNLNSDRATIPNSHFSNILLNGLESDSSLLSVHVYQGNCLRRPSRNVSKHTTGLRPKHTKLILHQILA